MNNLEVVEANTLRMKARIAIRGLGFTPENKRSGSGGYRHRQTAFAQIF